MRKLTNFDAVSGGLVRERNGGTYEVIDERQNKVISTTNSFNDALQTDMAINETDTVEVNRIGGKNEFYYCPNGKCPDAPIDHTVRDVRMPLFIGGYNFRP